MSSHVADLNAHNKSLTAKLLQQGYRYHKLRKTFSKFYRRHYELVSKFNVELKTLLHQGLSEPEFYGDLVYKFKKIVGRADFSDQFKKIIVRYKRIGYNINIMRQSACLVFNPITVNVGLKTLLHQGLSEPEFYGDLVYKFKKNVGMVDFCDQFRKIIVRYKRIGCNINIMRQSACLVFNPITVNNFASLFNCTPVGR